jgi:protein-tyrosine phosphatase
MLYHCTAGKDRTGWASVVILMALGVPKEDAVNDFLASNQYLVAKNEKYYAALPHIPRERLEVLLTVRRSFIDASFAEVERRYGGFDAYVRDGLGLDENAIRALKSRYLMP